MGWGKSGCRDKHVSSYALAIPDPLLLRQLQIQGLKRTTECISPDKLWHKWHSLYDQQPPPRRAQSAQNQANCFVAIRVCVCSRACACCSACVLVRVWVGGLLARAGLINLASAKACPAHTYKNLILTIALKSRHSCPRTFLLHHHCFVSQV